ncbi:MAG: hypothetical protein RPS99_01455 [Gammaproteobacteria bacterium]|jgi:hypothetical protein
MNWLDEAIAGFWVNLNEFIMFLFSFFPDSISQDEAIAGFSFISEYAAYPAYLTGIDFGIPIAFTAYLIKFTIRRIPFIG